MSPYELAMLFRTFSVLILETGAVREILLRQSEPDIRTNLERLAPRSKLVNTAHDPYRVSYFIQARFHRLRILPRTSDPTPD